MFDFNNYPLSIYNSLKKDKESFTPLHKTHVGMYVCGPTVYSEPHLGHARSAITYDVVFRYLKYLGYKVRYVRNITDVGHLEDEVREAGEDKIAKKARLKQLEPMEITHQYTMKYHESLQALNCEPPSIEPLATGHIPEQIAFIEKLLDKGLAYESNGSVYFDLIKYTQSNKHGQYGEYGCLSGKVLDDLITGTRQTQGRGEKKHSVDFALWKKAKEGHLMRWSSPWGSGFPGWHLECSAMSKKYLGFPFDIHGGGMDLQFPHHECEIAQNYGIGGESPVRYWIHNNLVTINGQKMSKSLDNFINLEDFFTGENPSLTQSFSPMVIRFFILQAHYRNTIDFSSEALIASEKGYKRLFSALKTLSKINPSSVSMTKDPVKNNSPRSMGDKEIDELFSAFHKNMSNDFNTAKALSNVFDLVTIINRIKKNPQGSDVSEVFQVKLKKNLPVLVEDVLGLKEEGENNYQNDVFDRLIDLIIEIREKARSQKDFETSDLIRDHLQSANIALNDDKDGTTFTLK